jgi:hypothetical protein
MSLPLLPPSVPSSSRISPDIFLRIASLILLPLLDIIPEITPLRSHLGQLPSYALLISYTTPISRRPNPNLHNASTQERAPDAAS